MDQEVIGIFPTPVYFSKLNRELDKQELSLVEKTKPPKSSSPSFFFAITYFFRSPISTRRWCKNSPAVISSYCFGFSSSIHSLSQSSRISLLGCIKKGIEYRGLLHCSFGGLITR